MKDSSALIFELQSRGFLYQTTDLEGLDSLVNTQKISAYVGFDCTAKSLHVGNLMQIILMRKLQQYGHKPIILLGGATTRIGDPSDKQGLRKMLSDAEISENKHSIIHVLHNILNFSDDIPNKAMIVDNLDWLGSIKYLDFLREYGVHFSINRMLTFDSVKNRLDRQSPLTFLEFNYMLLQAYDFMHLNKEYGCRLQCGGSEQWGNIVSGIELARRVTNAELFGITTPLITKDDGTKMGKTANGAVWLNQDMLSSYDFWQFWRNTADADVIRFMKLYTDISLEEIEKFSKYEGKDLNELKKRLADEVTALCHSAEAAQKARKTAEDAFEIGTTDTLPSYVVHTDNTSIYKIIVDAGLASSNSEARKLILGRGVKLNDNVVEDEKTVINLDKLPLKLSVGKKKHIMLCTE